MPGFNAAHIGSYEIIARIAGGGMGEVYRARRAGTNQEVALKVLHPHLAANAEFIARFLREAHTLQSLRHPHIVDVYDAGQADGSYFMAMEFVPRGSLQTRLDHLQRTGNTMPLNEALKLVRQVALALDYVHSNGFVHRDVKPSNILLKEDGGCVLTDFGIVLAQDQTRLTHTYQIIGTLAYMSPEQVKGLTTDGRSDIYSLGAVLYEVLTGSTPHKARDTPVAMLYAIGNEAVRPLSKLRPDLPRPVHQLVERALNKDPHKRFQTSGQLVSAIDHIPLVKAGVRWPVRPVPILTAISLLVLVSAVAVALMAMQGTRPVAPAASTRMTAPPARIVAQVSEATATLVLISLVNATPEVTQVATSASTSPAPSTTPSPSLPTASETPVSTAMPTLEPTQPPNTLAPTQMPNTSTPEPTATSTRAGPTGLQITGRVAWSSTPIGGSKVELHTPDKYPGQEDAIMQTVADADGHFTISAPPVGEYQLCASGPSQEYWEWYCKGLTVIANRTINAFTIQLGKKLTLLEPKLQALISDRTPTLTWLELPGAARYKVVVFSNVTLATAFQTTTSRTSVTVSRALVPGVTYSWQVDAEDAAGRDLGFYNSEFSVTAN